MLHLETIEPGTLQILKSLQAIPALKDFLLKHFSLQEILDLYMEKYPDGSVFIAMKSLTYFDDAESDPMPKMFEDVSWETVKNSIRKAVSQL